MRNLLFIIIFLLFSTESCYYFTQFKPNEVEELEISSKLKLTNNKGVKKNQVSLKKSISLITWNLGYAGLGKEADFFIDGGKMIYPVSKEKVLYHLDYITRFLKVHSADFYLLQEVTLKNSINYNVNIYEHLNKELKNYNSVFSKSLDIKDFPYFGNLIFGNALFSKLNFYYPQRISLPLETDGITGLFNQKFNYIKTSLPINNKKLVVFNLHLSAFDKGGVIRKRQLAVLKKDFLEEYKKGNYVIVGGDWNQKIVKKEFLHNISEEFLGHIQDLPDDYKPNDWEWGVDQNIPTVRTLNTPYKKGHNYRSIIDGFLISPNIEIVEFNSFDFEFTHSDHNPVYIKLKIIE